MDTPQIQYITSQEGITNAVYDALKKIGFARFATAAPAIESNEPKSPATKKEACAFLKISIPTLEALVKSGQLKSFNIGRSVRINWPELENYVTQQGK